jgi:hypothetical protein
VRLAALLLTASLALSAQVPTQVSGSLPWRAAAAPPWQMDDQNSVPAPLAAQPAPPALDLTVRIAADGALRITDAKGIIRLRSGLPGRPLRAWRDWGTPVPDLTAPLAFPSRTPLQRGIGGMPVGAPDFRPALEGLLWLLDDDETFLTVIHPATAQVVYLPLPGGQDLDLRFHPDRLEVAEGRTPGASPGPSWSLHWLALLPQFVQLGKDPSAGKPKGTALQPFPKEQ